MNQRVVRNLAFAGIFLGFAHLGAAPARAGIILQDNFNGENGGTGVFNYAAFTNWNVSGGTVDLIGGGFVDFLPGNGLYVDLDGSTNQAGLFSTKTSFAPGNYALQFDLAGSQRGTNTESVTVSFGAFSQVITRQPNDPFTTFNYNVTLAAAANLSFRNAGGDNIGALLDNVVVSTVTPAAAATVPEPATLALIGLGTVVLAGRRSWRKRS